MACQEGKGNFLGHGQVLVKAQQTKKKFEKKGKNRCH